MVLNIPKIGYGIAGLLLVSALVGVGFTIGKSIATKGIRQYAPDYAMQVKLAKYAASRAYYAGNRPIRFTNYVQ